MPTMQKDFFRKAGTGKGRKQLIPMTRRAVKDAEGKKIWSYTKVQYLDDRMYELAEYMPNSILEDAEYITEKNSSICINYIATLIKKYFCS